ncbi:MAG TPA: hypothetical protein VMZ49_01410 [Patescibacteria group bacterium]|nr:hypothetical protein [Patescibacteria group bacterium]
MGKLACVLLRVLAVLAVLAAFVALDWYPTVKELGLLRRQRGDLERKIVEYASMAAKFNFPDQAERSILANAKAELDRALPLVENDAAWTAIGLVDLQARAREDLISHARFLFYWQIDSTKLGTDGPGGKDPLTGWISRQFVNIQDGFSIAFAPGGFPWHEVFSGSEFGRGQLASRPMCIIAMAPLPALLGFINRLSWGEARLEIVRLRLEPGMPLAKAWLVCRGNYRIAAPSPWLVKTGYGKGGENLLVDPDSPLLWQKVDPLLAPRVEKKELPAAGSPW